MKYKPGDTVEWEVKKKGTRLVPFWFIVVVFVVGILLGRSKEDKTEFIDTPVTMPTDLPPDENTTVNLAIIPDVTEKKVEKKVEKPKESKSKYSQYQIAMWYLKAHESFRPFEYDDGRYPSKGFGLNLTPEHTKWATKVLGFKSRSRNWTFDEGQKLLVAYWTKKRNKFLEENKQLKPYQQTAILLHAYNTGKYTNIRGCCGSKKGCGRKGEGRNAKIRKAHNERRDFEWRLYNNLVTDKEIESLRKEAIALEVKWK